MLIFCTLDLWALRRSDALPLSHALAQSDLAMVAHIVACTLRDWLPGHLHQFSNLLRVIRRPKTLWIQGAAIIVNVVLTCLDRVEVPVAFVTIGLVEEGEVGLGARIGRRCLRDGRASHISLGAGG